MEDCINFPEAIYDLERFQFYESFQLILQK